jgi:hypothetical protein
MLRESLLLSVDDSPPRAAQRSTLFQILGRVLAVAVLCLSAATTARTAPVASDAAPLASQPDTPQSAAPAPATSPEAPHIAGPYRAYLPVVLRTGAWRVHDAPFGVEILRRGPEYVDWVGRREVPGPGSS